jgi:alkylhydroperoxidase family enzyme
MARVPLTVEEDLPEDVRYCLGRPISVLRSLGNAPGALQVHHEFAEWIRWRSQLDPRLRQLLIILVGVKKDSDYEVTHHIGLGQQFGVTDDDVQDLLALLRGEDAGDFQPAELAAITAAVQICDSADVDDQVWQELTAHYSHELATEIVVIVSFYIYVATVLRVFRIETEPEYDKYRPKA